MFIQRTITTYRLTKTDRTAVRKLWRQWVDVDVSNDPNNPVVKNIYNPVIREGISQETITNFVSFFEEAIDKKIALFESTIATLKKEKPVDRAEQFIEMFNRRIFEAEDAKSCMSNLLEVQQ